MSSSKVPQKDQTSLAQCFEAVTLKSPAKPPAPSTAQSLIRRKRKFTEPSSSNSSQSTSLFKKVRVEDDEDLMTRYVSDSPLKKLRDDINNSSSSLESINATAEQYLKELDNYLDVATEKDELPSVEFNEELEQIMQLVENKLKPVSKCVRESNVANGVVKSNRKKEKKQRTVMPDVVLGEFQMDS